MPRLLALLGAVAVCFGVRPLGAAEDSAPACLGRWVGEGRNTGHSTAWSITLTLDALQGASCGRIEHGAADLACGGALYDGHLERQTC